MESVINAIYTLFSNFVAAIGAALPKLFGAVMLLLVGWLIAKGVYKIVLRVAESLNVNQLEKKIKEVSLFSGLDFQLSKILAKCFFWIILIIFSIAAAEIAGLESISQGIASFLGYLPKLASAVIFFIVGSLAANLIRNIVQSACASFHISSGRFIAGFVFYFILIMVSISTLNQAGMDTQIITQNITIAMAAIFFAFAIGYGIASKDIMANIIASFYSRDKFVVGQYIKIDNVEGVILKIDNTSVVIESKGRTVIMPLSKLLNQNVEILPIPSSNKNEAGDSD